MDQQEIVAGLRELGLKRGDKVLLHSSLLSLGKVTGGPDAVIDAFLEVLGGEGTLLVPVFGALGILTETVKRRPGAVVSSAPVGTVAALGKDAEAICRDHWQAETAHGEGTPFTRLAEMGGYVCLLGVDQDRNTSLHSVEAMLKLPYLRTIDTAFALPDGRQVSKAFRYYPGPHRDFIGLDRHFREAGVLKIARIGNAQVRLIRSADLLRVGMALGGKDPAFVLCDNPECADCVKQRAAIFADRMSRESFRLTASSRLAGRYLPEMVENLGKAGIGAVELDYLQGKACAGMSGEKLAAVAAELTASGIAVSALAVPAAPDDPEKLLDAVRTAGIGRVILPVGAEAAAKVLAGAGIAAALRNVNHTARAASAAVGALAETCACRACFDPAAFAAVGEKPFLESYRVGRFIKIIGQLDLNDGLWDGEPRPLARGNGEVKELISILRCHNFDGWFCLGGGVRYPGTLKEAVADLVRLLDNM